MGKLREKFTKERIKEFCNRVGGRIRTSKIYDTYACVISTSIYRNIELTIFYLSSFTISDRFIFVSDFV